MAVFGKKAEKPSSKKNASKTASIADINAATSSVQEEPDEFSELINPTPKASQPAPSQLTGDKKSAYGSFSAQTYSESEAKRRKEYQPAEEDDEEFRVDHEVGVVYTDDSGREFYYDDYGTKHFADQQEPAPEIPASFEEARNSSSRERFQKEAEQAKQDAVNNSHQQPLLPPAPQYPVPSQDYNQQGYIPHPPHPSAPPTQGYTAPQGYSGVPFQHSNSEGTVNLRSGGHVENPYAEGAAYINEQIERGAIPEHFPMLDSTLASVANSSRSSEDITRTMLGYLSTTLAGEGIDATLRLLDSKNMYSALLVSALHYNLQQNPIDPVALKELWEIKPEVKIEEKVVYVKDKSLPVDGEKGFWVKLIEDEGSTPVFESLGTEIDKNRMQRVQSVQNGHISKNSEKFDYTKFDY